MPPRLTLYVRLPLLGLSTVIEAFFMTLTAIPIQETGFSTNQDFRFSNIDALIIKVTKRCNLDCEYCYEKITKSGAIL
jgi:uncharacterized radical SAM superfamily Fe-S cluster-containing enzyme